MEWRNNRNPLPLYLSLPFQSYHVNSGAHTTGQKRGIHSKLFYSKSPWLLLWMTSPIGGLEILARWKTNLLFIPHKSTWRWLDRQKYHPFRGSQAAIVVLANILRTLRCKVRKWSNSGQEQNWIGLSLRPKQTQSPFDDLCFCWMERKLCSQSHTNIIRGICGIPLQS